MKNTWNKKKKQALTIIIVLAGLFVLLLVLNALADVNFGVSFNKKDEKKKSSTDTIPKYSLYVPDFDYEVEKDKEYAQVLHYVSYKEGASEIMLTGDEALEEAGAAAAMLNDYFDSIKNGDYETYNTFFTPECLEDFGKDEPFTKQMLYNISVTLTGKELVDEGKPTQKTYYQYKVMYMIMKNNGTFRSDMGSDMCIPETYTVIEEKSSGEIRISDITEIVFVK